MTSTLLALRAARPRLRWPARLARALRHGLGLAALALGLLAAPAQAALIRINFALDFSSGPLSGQSAFGNLDVAADDCPGLVCNGSFTPSGAANPIVGPTGRLLAFNVSIDGVLFDQSSDDLHPDFPGVQLLDSMLARIDFMDFGGPPSLTIFGSAAGGWGGAYKDAAFDDSLIADVRQVGDAFLVPEPGSLLLVAGALLAGLAASGAATPSDTAPTPSGDTMERRDFLSGAATAAAAGTYLIKEMAFPAQALAQAAPAQQLVSSVWSRHVQWVRSQAQTRSDPYGTGVAIGEAVRAGGYAAVDLTVRDGGHVLPAQVATHLPLMLQGIRSTGAICDHIGVNFAPPTNAADTTWIASQFVHEILSVAGANGIRKYRFNNSGGQSFAANTFGQTMTTLLDNVRAQFRRLAAINAQYGGLCGVAHTHGSNIGNTVEPYAYAMQGIDPRLIGINLAIGHVATGAPGTAWQIAMRRWMPYIKCVAPEDLAATINPTTGALSIGRTAMGGTTGNGGGVINWTTFYSLLRLGGYSGAAENQLEYSITGGTGTSVSLNNADFADSANFTTGRLTPAIMVAEFRRNSDFTRKMALLGGWTADQILQG